MSHEIASLSLLLGQNNAKKLVKILRDSSLNFKYSVLEKATGCFDSANKLGQGGFGTVYKVVWSFINFLVILPEFHHA